MSRGERPKCLVVSGVSAPATMEQVLESASRANPYKMTEVLLVAGGKVMLTLALLGHELVLSW